MGKLFLVQEISEIMASMKTFSANEIANPNKRTTFYNKMMTTITKGARFYKHMKSKTDKKEIPTRRWILVNNDRLYWKEYSLDRNRKSKSKHLSKIMAVQLGKVTKALKQATDAPEEQCFSVITKKSTIDLQAENEKMAFEWVTYLNALVKHVKKQMQQANDARHILSALGIDSIENS